MPEPLAIVLLGLFGTVLGSFCNVIIDRLPYKLDEPDRFGDAWGTRPWREVLGGNSRCSSCGVPVKPYLNIPVVSWLLLRGKCQECGAPIPVFHPIVEVAVPALWIALWLSGATTWEFLAAYWLVPVGVTVSVIDFRTFIVPTKLIWPSLGVSAVLSVISAIATHDGGLLARGAVGLLALAGPLFLIFMVHPRGMGFGDVRLATLLGWTLGVASGTSGLLIAAWVVLIALAAASVIGLVVGIVAMGARGMKAKVPFGPPLVAGTFMCILFVDQLRSTIGS